MPPVKGPTYAELMFSKDYVANGGNASEAYRTAYPHQAKTLTPTGLSANACNLLKRPRVKAEIEKYRWINCLKREDVLAMAYDGLNVAKNKQNTAGIAQNARLIADLNGYIVQKHEDLTAQKMRAEEIRLKAEQAARKTLGDLSGLTVSPEGISQDQPELEPANIAQDTQGSDIA